MDDGELPGSINCVLFALQAFHDEIHGEADARLA
jgi:hypothetical protein